MGRVLVDIPEDKKLFREETYGKVVVMGRKTYESLTKPVSTYWQEKYCPLPIM